MTFIFNRLAKICHGIVILSSINSIAKFEKSESMSQ